MNWSANSCELRGAQNLGLPLEEILTCVSRKISFALASSESLVISQVLDALAIYLNEGLRGGKVVQPRLD